MATTIGVIGTVGNLGMGIANAAGAFDSGGSPGEASMISMGMALNNMNFAKWAVDSGMNTAAYTRQAYADRAKAELTAGITAAKDYISKGLALTEDIYKPYADKTANALQKLESIALDYNTSPLYKLQQEEGETAINRALSARGLWNSGAGVQALSDFNRKLIATEVDKMYSKTLDYNKLVSGMSTNYATLGSNLYNINANLERNKANNAASIELATGEALAKIYTSGMNQIAGIQMGDKTPTMAYNSAMAQIAQDNASAANSANSLMGVFNSLGSLSGYLGEGLYNPMTSTDFSTLPSIPNTASLGSNYTRGYLGNLTFSPF